MVDEEPVFVSFELGSMLEPVLEDDEPLDDELSIDDEPVLDDDPASCPARIFTATSRPSTWL